MTTVKDLNVEDFWMITDYLLELSENNKDSAFLKLNTFFPDLNLVQQAQLHEAYIEHSDEKMQKFIIDNSNSKFDPTGTSVYHSKGVDSHLLDYITETYNSLLTSNNLKLRNEVINAYNFTNIKYFSTTPTRIILTKFYNNFKEIYVMYDVVKLIDSCDSKQQLVLYSILNHANRISNKKISEIFIKIALVLFDIYKNNHEINDNRIKKFIENADVFANVNIEQFNK